MIYSIRSFRNSVSGNSIERKNSVKDTDKKKIIKAVTMILEAVGENPKRKDLH